MLTALAGEQRGPAGSRWRSSMCGSRGARARGGKSGGTRVGRGGPGRAGWGPHAGPAPRRRKARGKGAACGRCGQGRGALPRPPPRTHTHTAGSPAAAPRAGYHMGAPFPSPRFRIPTCRAALFSWASTASCPRCWAFTQSSGRASARPLRLWRCGVSPAPPPPHFHNHHSIALHASGERVCRGSCAWAAG
jgi:hypothetical protein